MPELPEVETIRAGLAPYVVGQQIESVEVHGPRTIRHHADPQELAEVLSGARIEAVARRGKFLWLELPGDRCLQVHLGMSGQLRVGDAVGASHLRATLHLVQGPDIHFLDQRTFGYLRISELIATPDGAPGGHGSVRPVLPQPIAHIGRDLLDPHLDRANTLERFTASRAAVKSLLLDQNLASGVGNIYADEALWAARIHPATPGRALGKQKLGILLDAAGQVMREALAQGGTSFDALYVHVNGQSGYFDRSLHVYGRTGQPCHRCAQPIERIRLAGRSAHLCPGCQRARWGNARGAR